MRVSSLIWWWCWIQLESGNSSLISILLTCTALDGRKNVVLIIDFVFAESSDSAGLSHYLNRIRQPWNEMEQLNKFRDDIDRIDELLISTLAMRFQITDKIGALKKTEKLPPVDSQREAEQEKKILEIAKKTGLREDIARSVLRLIIDIVVEDHKKA
jgi:chorismate mutase